MDLLEALFHDNSLYFDGFDRLQEAIYVSDAKGNIVYFNKVAEALDGYKLKDVRGKSIKTLYGIDETTSPLLKSLASEHPRYNEKFTYYINGQENIQICNTSPIYKDGQLVGAYSIQRDITPFKEIVEKNIALQYKIEQTKRKDERFISENPFSEIKGNSDAFMECKALAHRVSKTDSTIMLVGETGSGKEVFARAIHNHSNRANKPFLALNCAAIPETLIEGILFGTAKGVYTGAVEKDGILTKAQGGTVFLDEINSMSLSSQAKLLRVLEEKKIMKLGSDKETPIDVRIISSTNESPRKAIEEKHFREDLFYRLSVVQITIPPLRERKEDIIELTRHFIERYNKKFQKHVPGVNEEVMKYFLAFPWPGNVRQLKACMESAMNFATDDHAITMADLPAYIFEDTKASESLYRHRHFSIEENDSEERQNTPAPITAGFSVKEGETEGLLSAIEEEERRRMIRAIQNAKGNVAKAARALGISRQLMYYRVKKYQIKL